MDTIDMKEEKTMNTRLLWIGLVLLGALLFPGCISEARVGAVQTESQSVERGNAASVRVEINMGAGDMKLTGGAQKLLEANFTYNVAKLKSEVKYADGIGLQTALSLDCIISTCRGAYLGISCSVG
ncbi:MAG: toast rack family protein [Caldilineaceae bacterium]